MDDQVRAARAQREYEAALRQIGQRTLRYGRKHRMPVVVLCGALRVIHDTLTNAGLPHLLRENGVLPLPMDCLPLGAGVPALPRIVWGDASRALRAAVAARTRREPLPMGSREAAGGARRRRGIELPAFWMGEGRLVGLEE